MKTFIVRGSFSGHPSASPKKIWLKLPPVLTTLCLLNSRGNISAINAKKSSPILKKLGLFFLFTGLFFSKISAQWPGNAPITPDSFKISGTLKANTTIGDWLDGTGSGSFVITQTSGIWGPVNSATTTFLRDSFNSSANDKVFTGSSFSDNPNTWKWTTAKPTSKCDIATAMYHVSSSPDSKWIILGGDRYTTQGTSYIDFEFDQGTLTRKTTSDSFTYTAPPGKTLNNGRVIGDFVLSMEYSNGGATANVHYYVWELTGGAYKYVEHAVPVITSPFQPQDSTSAYGRTNADSTEVPYGAFGKFKYEPFAFVEAAVNIDAILGGNCAGSGLSIKTIFVKTKASDAYNAALKDFVDPVAVSFQFGSANMSYGDGTFCKSEGIATPTKSGTGIFSAIRYGADSLSPGIVWASGGATSTTGIINLFASAADTFIINYTFNAGGGCSGVQKDTIIINNASAGSISGDQTICSGGDPSAFGSVAGSAAGALTYQWQSTTGTCAAGTFANINSGGTSATYDPPSGLTTTTVYRRITTSTINNEACRDTSNCVTVTVNAITAGTIAGTQPVCSGGNPVAFIESVAGSASGTLSYQWQQSTVGCNSGFSNIANANAATYDVPNGITTTTYYHRIDTSTLTGVKCTATTNCVTVNVNANPTVTVNSPEKCANDPNVTITATPSPAGSYNYAWTVPGGAAAPGDNASFSASVAGDYSVIISNTTTGCTGSNSGTLTVNANPATPTADVTQPTCSVATGTITVTSGTTGLSFSINSTTPADFTNTSGVFSGLSAGNYTIRSKNSNGCISNGLEKTINGAAASTPAAAVAIISPVSCSSSHGTLKVVMASDGAEYSSDFEIDTTGIDRWYEHDHVFSFIAGAGYNFTVRRKSDHTCTATVSCTGESLVTVKSSFIENTETQTTTVKTYPNPFSDKVKFVVTSSTAGRGSLDVYDMMGRRVKTVYQGFISAGAQSFELSLPTQQIANLVYVLRIGDKKLSGKILQINQ